MAGTTIDQIIEYALEELLSDNTERIRGLVRNICNRWPSEPALTVVFALTNAASMIEDNLTNSPQNRALELTTYKIVALLAADIYAAEAFGHSPVLARDLLHFWRRVDGFFLTL